ncbi:hypothetical protein [Spongorhabdus nitratireducens]
MQEVISQIPATAWTAIVTALLTSMLTFFGVAYTNHSNNKRLKIQLEHERKLKQDDIIRERLEELYVESKKYMSATVMYFFPYLKVMEGELTFNQALDTTLEKKREHNHERVFLIMDMYFPELRQTFTEVEAQRDVAHDILHRYKVRYKTGQIDGAEFIPDFQDALELLTVKTSQFERHVSSLSRQITSRSKTLS